MPQRTQPLEPDYQRYSLGQVAERLSVLAQSLALARVDLPAGLVSELHIASLCCSRGQSRLEGLLESLEEYQQQRSTLESWLDRQIARLDQDCPRESPELSTSFTDELDRLRPDARGAYAWDRWQVEARAAGLSEELAQLGREVMREAVQHDWSYELKRECGWLDQGQVMLVQALQQGEQVAQRWQHLLATDGERGYWSADGEWHSGPASEQLS